MKKNKRLSILLTGLVWLVIACTSPQNEASDTTEIIQKNVAPVPESDTNAISVDSSTSTALLSDTVQKNNMPLNKLAPTLAEQDSNFVELIRLDSTFILDMRYATPNNFLKEKVYACAECLLRTAAAEALIHAHTILKKKGYRIKLFDCYRPLDVQKKMWKIMPDDRFVGNPYGNGSKHNKGVAVDLTLTDSQGHELDMGTPFDFFGREAYHAYTHLPTEVLERRRVLKQVMMEAGFSPITSEWWHYSYNKKKYTVSNYKPACL